MKVVVPETACRVSRLLCTFQATAQQRETQTGPAVPETTRGPRQLQSVGESAQEHKVAQEESYRGLQGVLLEPSVTANHIQYSEEIIWGWRKKHRKDWGTAPGTPTAWD